MGTREVRDPTTHNIIVDPAEQESRLSSAESGAYYLVIYAVMITTIAFTLFIILRRIGSLRHQLQMGRQRKLLRDRDDGSGDDDEGTEDGALPDEIAALIHKSRMDAASAWFNEKANDRYRKEGSFMRMLYLCRRCGRQGDDDQDLAALAKYKVVQTRIFVPQMPFPGQVSQLKKRLSRKLGVLRVTVDVENCTVFCWHDLSVCSGPVAEDLDAAADRRRQFLARAEPGGGSVRFSRPASSVAGTEDSGRRNAAAAELLRVVNSVIQRSRVYSAAEDGKIDLRAWASSLLPILVGGLIVLLHQMAELPHVDCSRVTTIPMNCSTYRNVFVNGSNGLMPAVGWTPETQASSGDNVTCNSSDSDGTYFEADCARLGTWTPGCNDPQYVFGGCDFRLHNEGLRESTIHTAYAPFHWTPGDLLREYFEKNRVKKHHYTCKEFQTERSANKFGLHIG